MTSEQTVVRPRILDTAPRDGAVSKGKMSTMLKTTSAEIDLIRATDAPPIAPTVRRKPTKRKSVRAVARPSRHSVGASQAAFCQQDWSFDEHAYALEVSGNSMEPAYRDGTIIVVSPTTPVRRGDRVVVKTKDGEVMAKELKRRTSKSIDLGSLNPDHKERTLSVNDVTWIARIMWASQ